MAGINRSAPQGAQANTAPQGAGKQQRVAPPRVGAVLNQLNPERAPPLIAKWQKALGKDLEKIEVVYEADSVSVYLYGKRGTSFNQSDSDVTLTVPEYRAIKARATAPSLDERLQAFKDKFELRLNRAFPAQGPASGNDADIRVFLGTLDFHQRRAMLMSNKQFKSAYPNGFTGA